MLPSKDRYENVQQIENFPLICNIFSFNLPPFVAADNDGLISIQILEFIILNQRECRPRAALNMTFPMYVRIQIKDH
jgi:hypothetical protein